VQKIQCCILKLNL